MFRIFYKLFFVYTEPNRCCHPHSSEEETYVFGLIVFLELDLIVQLTQFNSKPNKLTFGHLLTQ